MVVQFFTKHIPYSRFFILNIELYDRYKWLIPLKCFTRIDPSVRELKNNREYSNIDKLVNLVPKIKGNVEISIDYPSDMNPKFENEFIEKTYEFNKRFRDNPHYTKTLQYGMLDFESFCFELNRLDDLGIDWSQNTLGIGNLCRLFRYSRKNPNLKSYKKYTFVQQITCKISKFVQQNNVKSIHLYGIGIDVIKDLVCGLDDSNGLAIGIDTTKWTRSIDSALKRKYGLNSTTSNLQFYFWDYMYRIVSELYPKRVVW